MKNIDKQPDHDRVQSGKCQNEKNAPSRIKRLQTLTATIAISILIAITAGVAGIEMLQAKQKEVFDTVEDSNGSRSLRILAYEREKNQPGISNSLPRFWDSEPYTSETSLEVQRLQARKIKELKRQLSETNQKLYDVKANLFTKGDPADRARLANVCQELVEKEKRNAEFQKKIAELENEREIRGKKIVRMEQTIDALAAMTDSLRESKEKRVFNFQSQIERLEEDAERERKELKKIQADLEESNMALQDSLAAKISTIKTLEEEILWQYNLLREKDQEIKSQARLFTSSENYLQTEKNHLLEALELEMLKNRTAVSEIEKALAREKAQEQNLKSLDSRYSKERMAHLKQIDQLTSNLANMAKEYIELQGIANVYAHSQDHLTSRQAKLAALVREGKSQIKGLQSDLETAFAAVDAEQQRGLCIEEELHASAQKASNLQEELFAKQALIEQKEHELETLNYSTASLRDQLNARIQQLSASLREAQDEKLAYEENLRKLTMNSEVEKAKYQELYSKFQDILSTNDEQALQIHELQQQVYEDSERIFALEDRARDKQGEVDQLKQSILTLTQSLNDEKQRSNELHTALSRSLNENESLFHMNSTLQAGAEENTNTLTLLQDRIESKKQLVNDMQNRLDDVSSRLAYEQNKNREMEIALQDSKSQIHAEKLRARELVTESDESREALDLLKNDLIQRENQISILKRELKNQTAYSDELSSKLDTLRSSPHTSSKNQDFDQMEVIEYQQHQIAKLSQMLESERSKMLAVDRAKLNKSEHAQLLERKVEESNARIVQLETKIHEQQRQLAEFGNQPKSISTQRDELAMNDHNSAKSESINSPIKGNASAQLHKVENGENLGIISTYYYGSPNRWIDIYNANRGKIPDKNNLQVGIELTIPQ